MPTFHLYKNGQQCDEIRGADRAGLEQCIRKHYVKVDLPEEMSAGEAEASNKKQQQIERFFYLKRDLDTQSL